MLRSITLGVLLLMPAPLAAQGRADMPKMIEAAVEYLRTEINPSLIAHEIGKHPMYVNAASLAAFQSFAPRLDRIPEEGRNYQVKAREAAVTCGPDQKCQVANGGILLHFVNIGPLEEGRYRLRIDPEYNRGDRAVKENSFVLEMQKVDGDWKVAKGTVLVD